MTRILSAGLDRLQAHLAVAAEMDWIVRESPADPADPVARARRAVTAFTEEPARSMAFIYRIAFFREFDNELPPSVVSALWVAILDKEHAAALSILDDLEAGRLDP